MKSNMSRLAVFLFALFFQASLLAAPSKTKNQAPMSSVVISNDISGNSPDRVEPVPIWSVVVLSRSPGLLLIKECTGSLLSSSFVLTSRHCIYNKAQRKALLAKDIAVIKSGDYDKVKKIGGGLAVEKVYGDYGGDIALLQIVDPIDVGLMNFPIYHGYHIYFSNQVIDSQAAVIYGASGYSMGEQNTSLSLYWSSIKIVAWNYSGKRYVDRGYVGRTFSGELYDGPPLDPREYPKPGLSQPGDSGGTVHVFLPDSSRFHTATRKRKAIGVNSTGSSRNYTAAALDDEAIRWIGGHVGMIVAPDDSKRYGPGGYIDVDVTDADVQPIAKVDLVDQGGRAIRHCSPFRLKSEGIISCLLPKPDKEGLYAIRAYRIGDESYDEVDIECVAMPADTGDGLRIYRP